MSLRVLALWGCAVCALSLPVSAQAGASFGPRSNVLSIALGTPGRDAKLSVAKNFRSPFVTDIHALFGAGQTRRDVVVGFLADVTAVQDQQANAATQRTMAAQRVGNSPLDQVVAREGDLGRDQVTVAIDPNEGSHRVYAIERTIEFPTNARPLMATVEASLIAKYGPASRTATEWPGVVHYYWFTNASLAKRSQFVDQCLQEGEQYDAPISPGRSVRNYDPNRDITSYPYLMSYINTRTYFAGQDIKKCGTILAVTLTPPRQTGQEQYVGSMSENLFDFAAGSSYVKAYATTFWAQANGASQQKLNRDAKIKPTL